MSNIENKVITLRSVYGKVKDYHFQPGRQPNGLPYPFVKKVDADGTMILSEREKNDPESAYFLSEDMDIHVTDGTTFNLANPLERNKWESIKNNELIVPMRGATDENGNLVIDGDKKKYGLAELWVDVPGEESERNVSRRKLITKAWNYIESDSAEGRSTKVKLLGKIMRNAPDSDVMDYLYQKAEKNPNSIIELYTSSDAALKLLLIDAKEKNIIRKVSGTYMYADNSLGQTDEAVILFFKNPSNIKTLESIKTEVFPDYVTTILDKDSKDKGGSKDDKK